MVRTRFVLIVLAPALALAAPRGHRNQNNKKRKPDPAADKKPIDDATEVSETPDSPTPSPESGASGAAASDREPASKPDAKASAGAPQVTPPDTDPGPVATPAKPDSSEPDVDSLRQEYLSLRDELFKSRARASAVSSQLYTSRIEIRFTWASGRQYGVSKASVRLDGASVYDDATGAIAGNDGIRFEGYIAPGRHTITFHVEATGKDDDAFASSTDAQVVVKAVANKNLTVAAKGHDVGDIAYEWKRSERGSYGLGIDVAVKTAQRADVAASPKGKK